VAPGRRVGAGHPRIARQLVIESPVLTTAGGLGGILLGRWLLSFLSLFDLDALPRGAEIRMDAVVVTTMLVVAVLIGLLIAVVPVARLLRARLATVLRDEGRGGTSGQGPRRTRPALAMMQFAFAFALLACAGPLV